MATVHDLKTRRNTVVKHYAHLDDVWGIATLTAGGYLFQADGTGARRLVAYNSPELVLHGYIDDTPETDTRPLWQQVADPGYYEGRQHRTLVNGR